MLTKYNIFKDKQFLLLSIKNYVVRLKKTKTKLFLFHTTSIYTQLLYTLPTVMWTEKATCHVSKQRMLLPSASSQTHTLTVHPEGIQDGEKQDPGPR